MSSASDSPDDDIIVLEGGAKGFVPRPLEGIARQKAEEYLEEMKKWHPQEYEELMKQRELILREREAKKKQEPE